jgi:hypothetical protein
VPGGNRDQTLPGDGRRRQLSHSWNSVSTRLCARKADFDELTVQHLCPSIGLEIIILYAGFAHSCGATLARSVDLETSVVLMKLLEKIEVLAPGGDRRSCPQAFLAKTLVTTIVPVAGGPYPSRTGKQIQSRSDTDSHITLERCEMRARYAVGEKCDLVYK